MANEISSYEAEVMYAKLIDTMQASITTLVADSLKQETKTSYISFLKAISISYKDEEGIWELALQGLYLENDKVAVDVGDEEKGTLSSLTYEDLLFLLRELEEGKFTIYTQT